MRTDFPTAGGKDCQRTADGFLLTIQPEATPINHSPWFAFDVITATGEPVTVTLEYTYSRHRYVPKINDESNNWAPLTAQSIKLSDNEQKVVFDLHPEVGSTRIAGQPVLSTHDRLEWVRHTAATKDIFELTSAGKSVLGVPLPRLSSARLSNASKSQPLVVLLGSQHPPEVPGWLAMMAFIERLSADDILAKEFRENFRVEIFPILNPDGIDAGHWRFNADLVDINRDWGPFTQPETKMVDAIVASLSDQGHQPILMVDFHATFKGDILYTPNRDVLSFLPNFSENWGARITELVEGEGFQFISSHNPGLPTAKSWFTETYNAPGITLEIGDETPPVRIRTLSIAAAEAMMTELLATKDLPK